MKNENKLKGKKILVTGGAGFIGSEVVRQLSSRESRILVFDNFSSGRKKYVQNLPNVKLVKGDISKKPQVQKITKDVDYILNLAALPFIPDSFFYPDEFFKVNTIGTINLVMASMKSKRLKRFVHISSSEIYGSAKKIPMSEDHPTLPHSTYATSKLAGERAVYTLHKEHGFPAIIIRPFNSYGPRITQPYIIPEIITQFMKGSLSIKLGNVKSTRDFTYVSDTARAIIYSLTSKNSLGETINVGSGNSIKIKDLAALIAKIMNKKFSIKIDKKRLRPYDVENLICDNTKARRLLKWKPLVSIEEGLTNTINWMKANHTDFVTPFKGWPKAHRMKLVNWISSGKY